jgi:hypothetical protein
MLNNKNEKKTNFLKGFNKKTGLKLGLSSRLVDQS